MSGNSPPTSLRSTGRGEPSGFASTLTTNVNRRSITRGPNWPASWRPMVPRVVFVDLPVVRDENGNVVKMGIDDFIVKFGSQAFRNVVAKAIAPDPTPASLDDFRAGMAKSRDDVIGPARRVPGSIPARRGQDLLDHEGRQASGSAGRPDPDTPPVTQAVRRVCSNVCCRTRSRLRLPSAQQGNLPTVR